MGSQAGIGRTPGAQRVAQADFYNSALDCDACGHLKCDACGVGTDFDLFQECRPVAFLNEKLIEAESGQSMNYMQFMEY